MGVFRAKKFSVLFIALCTAVFVDVRPASAALLNYSFTMNNNGFSGSFVTGNTSQTRYFHGPGTIDVTYDTVALTLHLEANSIGTIYGADGSNNLDFGNVLVSNVTATGIIDFTNIVPGIGPDGLVGLFSNGATGAGTFTFSDIGLGNGATVLAVQSSPMSGADFGMLPAANSDYADLVNLGNGIYWQFIVTSPLSSLFGKMASFSWYDTPTDVIINGINFGRVHTDLLGSAVPEPATLLLTGLGLGGALLRRRRSVEK